MKNQEIYAEITINNTSLKTIPLKTKESCGEIAFETPIFCIELSEILNKTLSDPIKLSVLLQNSQIFSDSPLITLFYPDNIVNNLQYNTPIESLLQKIDLQTINSFTKSLQFTLESVQVLTDEGYMTEDLSTLSFISSKTPFESLINPTSSLFVIKINKSPSNTLVSRNYMKLYTVLANVGGLIKMLWLIIFLIINPFITLQYKKSLMNEIFNFNENEFFFKTKESVSKRSIVNDAFLKLSSFVQNFKKEKFTKKSPIERFSQNFKKSMGTIKHREKIDSPTKQVITDIFKIKETNLDISAFESLLYYVCDYREINMKKELIQRGSKAINKRIDIAYIIQKIVEIEKLKVLLLDSDQLKLFEYLPKPLLTNNKREKLFSKRIFLNKVQNKDNLNKVNYFHEKWKLLEENNDKNNILEKVTNLSQSFQKIKSKRLLTELDQKLLGMMDENIKNLLEKTDKSPRIRKFITETNGKKQKASLKLLLSLFSVEDESQQKKGMEKIEENVEKEQKEENTIKEFKENDGENTKNNEENKENNENNDENNGKNSEKNEERVSLDSVENRESVKKMDIKKEINRLNSNFKFFKKDENSFRNSSNDG